MDKNHFPHKGKNQEDIFQQMEEYRHQDADWKKGKTFSLVYHFSNEHHEFLKTAHNKYFSENGLNPMTFKSLKKFEHEVVRMSADLFNGDDKTVGVMTSGGTESLLMAIKTYRDRAKKTKPWILSPEVIIPATAHVALDKAGHYFGVKIRHAKVGSDQKVDIKEVKKLINRNTILLLGSAPQYPHGVIDPIAQLSELAILHNLPLHIDACIGGFILPFVERLGYPIEIFDFRARGVTSISADIHKYGYGAKGASVLLYRSMEIMKHQFFIYTDWNGGIYASPSLPGTRPGGPIAAAWATFHKLGEEGYLEQARIIMKTRDSFLEGLKKISDLECVVYPDASIVAYQSKNPDLSIYAVADQLERKGWAVDRQQNPECIHITLSPIHSTIIEEYLADLKFAVEYVLNHPELAQSGQAAMYGMMAKIPFRSMIKSSVLSIMQKMYGPLGELPDERSEEVLSWSDLVEKMGNKALGLKSELEKAWRKAKSK